MHPKQTDELQDRPAVVQCRKGLLGWLAEIGLLGFAILCLAPLRQPSRYPRDMDDLVIGVSMSSLLLLGSLLFAAFLLRARIVADDLGLRWRGLRGWKTARWEEVVDYYDKRLQNGQQFSVIETTAGKLTLDGAGWNNVAAMRDFVHRRATQSHARAWEERGKRAEERWPLVFDYNTADNRWMPVICKICGWSLLICFTMMLIQDAPKYRSAIAEIGWARSLGRFATAYGIMILEVGLAWAMALAFLKSIRRRRLQKITATRDGLTFEDGERRIESPWSDILEYFTPPRKGLQFVSPRAVVSRQGTFDFVPLIRDYRLLNILIERYAPEAAERGRRTHPDEDDLLPNRTSDVTGERTYHYRTRTNRSTLVLVSVLALTPALLGVLSMQGLLYSHNASGDMAFSAILYLPILWGWRRYFTAKIRTDSLGITQFSPFGKRFLSWGEVEDYYISGGDILTFGNVVGFDKRIRFWISIANMEELKAEIVRRAVHSRTKEWTEKNTL